MIARLYFNENFPQPVVVALRDRLLSILMNGQVQVIARKKERGHFCPRHRQIQSNKRPLSLQ